MIDTLAKAECYLDKVGILDAPGAVLYSGVSTLRQGSVYLLGLNPGGSENASIRDSLVRCRAEHNAYLDERWAPGGRLQPVGKATLQRRIQQLCAMMGFDTREVPASNLVFTRSTRLNTHLNFSAACQLCLPVHHIFLDAIQPKFLMTFGAIKNFKAAVEVRRLEELDAEHGSWKAHRGEVVLGGQTIHFGNVPHMSLWASDKRPNIVKWAIEGLAVMRP